MTYGATIGRPSGPLHSFENSKLPATEIQAVDLRHCISGGGLMGGETNSYKWSLWNPCSKFAKSSSFQGSSSQIVELRRCRSNGLVAGESDSSRWNFWLLCKKPSSYIRLKRSSVVCFSTGMNNTETKECIGSSGDCSNISSAHVGDDEEKRQIANEGNTQSRHGLADACRFVQNDARFVNERARSDIVLLSRGIMRLDARARQDVAILGSGFLKLDGMLYIPHIFCMKNQIKSNKGSLKRFKSPLWIVPARARKDTEKIDRNMKKKAERLHHIATILKHQAQSKLKTAADQHWSDGALEADLRLADFRAKQRAMEDALMALEFMKNIHDIMVSKMYKFSLQTEKDDLSSGNMMGRITLQKNGKNLDFFPGEVSTDRITAIQDAYWSMASALSEADGIDYTDPDELESLITTLIDLDAMDGKSSVSLLAECSSSPNVSTRQALANALATAPSMWTLGNAGMGALQRLAEDSNPSVAAAASKAIHALRKQWEIEEGDSWKFMMNKIPSEGAGDDETIDDASS